MATSKKTTDIELRLDGWERFQRAVSAAVKGGPKHRSEKSKAKTGKRPGFRKR
jgi:hypothetical protein